MSRVSILGSSKRQVLVGPSSFESKYNILSQFGKEAVWLFFFGSWIRKYFDSSNDSLSK